METFAIFLVYKRMPNNCQTTWIYSNCKVSQAAKVTTYNLTKSSSTGPSTCSFFTSNNANTASTNSLSEERVQLTQAKEDINKRVTLSNNTRVASRDKKGSLRNLDNSHFEIINSPIGWLDYTIIQQAQVCLQRINKYYIQETCTGSV